MIVQYTSIMKEEPYLVLQAINSLLGPKEGVQSFITKASQDSPSVPSIWYCLLSYSFPTVCVQTLELVCVSLLVFVRENTAKKECLWRMAFSFNEGVYFMDLAPCPPRFVSLPKDKP